MPRSDVRKVLVVGPGPTEIGAGSEIDDAAAQGCRALRQLGVEVVLVGSGPAAEATSDGCADRTYVEPLEVASLTEILAAERPDALLPSLGGQRGLNLASRLQLEGILADHGCRLLGLTAEALEKSQDLGAFREAVSAAGVDVLRWESSHSVAEAKGAANRLGYPVMVRPYGTAGGMGSGLAYNVEELESVVSRAIATSASGQALVEESPCGWEELVLEVLRDHRNQTVTACCIESVDPLGMHSGDSLCVTPMLTVEAALRTRLEAHAHRVVDACGIVGSASVKLAHDPGTGRIVAIAMAPGASRSSALASRATGLPIAIVSVSLAAGLTLDEIPCAPQGTLDKYQPAESAVVVRLPRWSLDRLRGAQDRLGPQMRSVGEVMAIGRTFKEALQKGVRSLEAGQYGLGFARGFHGRSLNQLLDRLHEPTSERLFLTYEALRKGASVAAIHARTHVKPWFIEQTKELVVLEEALIKHRHDHVPDELLIQAKRDGFSDRYLAQILGRSEGEIRAWRQRLGVAQGWETMPPVVGDGPAPLYSSYGATRKESRDDRGRPRVMLLGGGPHRIGQGIQLDTCSVQAAGAIHEAGLDAVLVNCNPAAASTGPSAVDRLYLEPLAVEDVLAIYERERPEGVVLQFAGQTAIDAAQELATAGIRVLGTSPDAIDLAEDRDRFRRTMEQLSIPMPEAGVAATLDECLDAAERIGYPVMIRPSSVLGRRGTEVAHDEEALRSSLDGFGVTPERPVRIMRFLEGAVEVEVDALADGASAFTPTVMEHIEEAGIHSGDSACTIPPVTLTVEQIDTIVESTQRIARALKVVGLLHVRFAVEDGLVYVLEAHPRASRTVPFVSRVCEVPMARLATQLILGAHLDDLQLARRGDLAHVGVKEAILPFAAFPEVDPVLGIEMRSTGSALGLGSSFGMAYAKAQRAAGLPLPDRGTVLVSVNDHDKPGVVEVARQLVELGFTLRATAGTQAVLARAGIPAAPIFKMHEARPHVVDEIVNGNINMIVNTPAGRRSQHDDSHIRKAAVRHGVPYVTTVAAARAAAHGIAAHRQGRDGVRALQDYRRLR
jgi:carbamoyl-phosphate synthase large subunit